MPIVSESEIEAYAYCPNARCDGHKQVKLKAIRTETGVTYMENGGDLAGVERSFVHVKVANTKQAKCSECGLERQVSETRRRQYQGISGHDQKGLLQFMPDVFTEGYEPEYESLVTEDAV